MTAKQLEALLIDRDLGELSEEASALLDAWLAQFPERRAEADRIRETVGLVEVAVLSRPLALEPDGIVSVPPRHGRLPAWFRSAAAVALLGLAVGAGFVAGKGGRGSPPRPETVPGSEAAAPPSPWARYHLEENGRLAVILPGDPQA